MDCLCTPTYDGLTITYQADLVQVRLLQGDPELIKRIIKEMLVFGMELYAGRLTDIGKPNAKVVDGIFTVFLPCVIDGKKKKTFASDTKVDAMKARGYDFHAVINGEDVYISSDSLTDEKKKMIYDKYGLEIFIEETGDKHLVLYDPSVFHIMEMRGKSYLNYCGSPETTNFPLPYNCSSMFYMFVGSGIKKVDFTGCDLSGIATMECAFWHTKIQFVGFGDQKMTRLKTTKDCFRDCYYLKSVFMCYTTMPNLETASGMFAGCANLCDVDIGYTQIHKLNDTEKMFLSCSELSKLEFPEWNVTLDDAKRMFAGCKNLALVTMHNVHFEDTECDHMFIHCNKLRLFVPGNFNVPNDKCRKMFEGCLNLNAEFKTLIPNNLVLLMKKLVLDAIKKQQQQNDNTSVEQKAEPMVEPVTEPIAEQKVEPVTEPIVEQKTEPVIKPMVSIEEAVLQPEIEPEQVKPQSVDNAIKCEVDGEEQHMNEILNRLSVDELTPEQKKKLAIAKKKGFDVYCVIKGKDVFINSKEWTAEKDDKLFAAYGVRFSKERGVYNPDIQIVQSFM